MDLSVVIPYYNEIDNVAKLRDELLPVIARLAETCQAEVVFVDDGSTDGTYQALVDTLGNGTAQVSLRYERHEVNRGLGAALRTGFAAACGEVIVSTDSDGTYRFSEIPALLSCLTPEVDIVTASPYHPRGGVAGVPGYRLVLSRGSSAIYRILVRWSIHTYTCLFRAYRRRVIERVPFQSDGFLAGTELLVNGMLMGYRVAEYPAVLYSRAGGTSKAKLVRTIRAHLGFQGRVLLRRLGLMSAPTVTGSRVIDQQGLASHSHQPGASR
jgi:dolichol-phosphate mannosyltransferase